MKQCKFGLVFFLLASLSFFISCNSGSNSDSTVSGAGSLSLSLTDAKTPEYNAVYITVNEVQVHPQGGGWLTILSYNKTLNLLDLVDGVREDLGIAILTSGVYTQMRMILGDSPDNGINILSEFHPYGNYVIDKNNFYHPLKIPSGFQSGIKIVHGFHIYPDKISELILDFDVSKSVIKAGKSGKWLLKPTIKVLDIEEASMVTGTVLDVDDHALEGVWMSAQIYDPNAGDIKDKVIVQASTATNAEGKYTMFLHPGTYNLVASREDYIPSCTSLVALLNTVHTRNFALQEALTGAVEGEILITGAGEEQNATLSFRQMVQCGGEDQLIEVKSIHVVNFGDYSVVLPEGPYEVSASSYGEATQEHDIDVIQGTTITLDITF